MATKEVTAALEKLHSELERLEPALEHVEAAREVTKTISSLKDQYLDLIKAIKDLDSRFKKELTNDFKNNVNEIKSTNSKIAKDINKLLDSVAGSIESSEELREQIKRYYENIEKINFPERLDKLDSTVSGINIGIQNVQSKLQDVDRSIAHKFDEVSHLLNTKVIEIIKHQRKSRKRITWLLIIILIFLMVNIATNFLFNL